VEHQRLSRAGGSHRWDRARAAGGWSRCATLGPRPPDRTTPHPAVHLQPPKGTHQKRVRPEVAAIFGPHPQGRAPWFLRGGHSGTLFGAWPSE